MLNVDIAVVNVGAWSRMSRQTTYGQLSSSVHHGNVLSWDRDQTCNLLLAV